MLYEWYWPLKFTGTMTQEDERPGGFKNDTQVDKMESDFILAKMKW